jgi:hypothetical protein
MGCKEGVAAEGAQRRREKNQAAVPRDLISQAPKFNGTTYSLDPTTTTTNPDHIFVMPRAS